MTRPLAVLVGLVLVLWAGAAALPAREDARRAHLPAVARTSQLAGLGDATVAGFAVQYAADGRRFRYARARGRWRALDAFNAACDDERAGAFVLGLLGSTAVRRVDDPASFGLQGPDSLVLSLHGKGMLSEPAGDVLLELRIGDPSRAAGAAAASGAFARIAGEDGLFELDLDPRELLGPYSPGGFPPLLDTRLVPFEFPPPGSALRNVYLERPGQPTLELARRPREPLAPGPDVDPDLTLPFEWSLSLDGEQLDLPPWRAEGYSTFTLHARFVGLEDPREFDEHGFDEPGARLTLVSEGDESVVLEFGAATAGGGAWVLNRAASLLVTVDPATLRMLQPDVPELTDTERENLWDTFLRAELQAER